MSGAEIMLINPRHRRRRSRRRARVTHARRNPIRRRRRRRMSVLQQQFFGKRRRRVARYRRNPIFTAPRKRRRHRRRRSARMSFRRNPITMGSARSFMRDTLVPAGVGAAGALAIDVLWGYLPLPATLMTGTFAPLTRIAAAVAVGYLVGMIAGKRYGEEAMAGAITVTLYDLAKTYLTGSMGMNLGAYVGGIGRGLGYIAPAVNAGMGAYVGEYTY